MKRIRFNRSLWKVIPLFYLLTTLTLFAQTGWQEQETGSEGDIYAIDYYTDTYNTLGWAAGQDPSYGLILHSSNGTSWGGRYEASPWTTLGFIDISFATKDYGAAVNGSVIYITYNGGTTWLQSGNDQITNPRTVYYLASNALYAGGPSGIVSKSTDQGSSFTKLGSTGVNFIILSVFAVDANNIHACGASGWYVRSTNGGSSWSSNRVNWSTHNKMFFTDASNGWMVSDNSGNGELYRTTDGGASWSSNRVSGVPTLYDVHFINSSEGWTVGKSGNILHSTDGGNTWSAQASGTTNDLYGIHMKDANTGWAAGKGGLVLYTTDGGFMPVELTTFTAERAGSNVILNWETATEVNNYGFEIERNEGKEWKVQGFVKGAGSSNIQQKYTFTDSGIPAGKIAYRLKQIDNDGKTEYSDIIGITGGVPVEYSLDQNFPNPFNPSTVISFDLPRAGNVSLEVYNLVGEKISEAVNRYMEAGNHKIDLDMSGYPAGVYIYTLKAGDYSFARKMTYLK